MPAYAIAFLLRSVQLRFQFLQVDDGHRPTLHLDEVLRLQAAQIPRNQLVHCATCAASSLLLAGRVIMMPALCFCPEDLASSTSIATSATQVFREIPLGGRYH